MLQTNVFNRTNDGAPVVSTTTYNLVIGLVLCWGFLLNWIIVQQVNPEDLSKINPWLFFGGYFVSCLLGVYLFNSSKNPLVSFLGYNFVVLPFGLTINMVVSRFDPAIVVEAIQITAGVTVVMMICGVMFPAFFQAIHKALFISLLAVIVVELVQIFIFHTAPTWTDWIVVTIFCGYMGYDWGRANQIPKTIDNAVDSAAAIYMDIVNLFLRILRILGRRR